MMCHDLIQKCHLLIAKRPPNEHCGSGPGSSSLREHLKTIFDHNQVTEVKFEKWLDTDLFTISIQILSFDFVD